MTELWRKVADITICLCSFLMSHPDSRNVTASQSRSSGCDGIDPCDPKSSEVSTRPRPKWSCHIRFTKTRDVSGCFGSKSHRASPSRSFGNEPS